MEEYVVFPREVVMPQTLSRFAGRIPQVRTVGFCLLCFTLALAPRMQAQTDDSYQSRRAQAMALYRNQKLMDALPLLEKLHAEKAGDVPVLEALSFATLASSATLTDPAGRKRVRAHARKLAEEAKAAGDDSNLLKVVLSVPEDGGEMAFSGTAEVQAVMQQGEAAFAKGDMDAAIAAYAQALALDPHQYDAALFIGDVYFKQKNHEQADKWFAKAVEIDPNRETAYRYWGDDLMEQSRASEAKEQFISAVVADPYNQRSWIGLSQWAKHENKTLGAPRIVSPNQIEDTSKGHTNITIDPSTMQPNAKKDGSDAWFSCSSALRGTATNFKKNFPTKRSTATACPRKSKACSPSSTVYAKDSRNKKSSS
jgi:tetratricopeptide (TPR) repeat protein